MMLQTVESYSDSKAGIHNVHFYFKRSSAVTDTPQFVYKLTIIYCKNDNFDVDDVA